MTILLRWNKDDGIYEVAPGARPIHRNLTSGRPGGRDPDLLERDSEQSAFGRCLVLFVEVCALTAYVTHRVNRGNVNLRNEQI